MTVIRPNSISGITSLTAHRGSIDFYAHDGSAATFNNINSNVTSGVSTFASLNITGDLDVGGALTYEDVTNVDSIGVITARSGLNVTGGSVGIGTDNPSTTLHLSSATPIIKLQDSDSAGSAALQRIDAVHSGDTTQWFVGQNSTSTTELWIQNVTNDDIRFGTNNTERVRITSAGNVGINDTAPSQKLNVGGNIMLEGGDQFMYLTNVGTGNAGIYVRGNTSGSFLRSHTTGMFTWEVTGSEKMRITSDGDMGLGTASPTARLDVRRGDTDGKIAEFHQSTGYGIQIRSSESTATIRAEYNQELIFETGTTATERLRIESNGYVKTSSEFWVGGASPVLRWRNGGTEYATARISSNDLYFEVAGTEKLRIKSDGKIGINASSGWNAYGDVLLVQGNTGATAKCMISVRGGSTGYVHSALKLSATTHSNSGGNQRGLGVFMHDETSNVEWYAGRPYATSDYFLIARNTGVSNANAGGVTAQHSMRKWEVDSSGRTVQTGGIYTYQPGQAGSAKSSRAIEAKGASGTYSQCVVELDQHSYGSVAWDIKVGGYHSAHQHVAGTYYCNGALYANYTSINNSANVSYTRAWVSGQIVRHTFYYHNGFVHPVCEVTATVGGDGYFNPGDITITWS